MGFCFSGTANYLYHHPSGYFFRYRIPQDLKAVVGKTEFRYSLRTGIFRIARYRARLIAGYVCGRKVVITVLSRYNLIKWLGMCQPIPIANG